MAASDKQLGHLHLVVAKALTEQVEGYEEEVSDGVTKTVRPSPAVLSAAIAFLKNNNITADATDNAALRELGEALQARRKKKLPQADLDAAAERFAESQGTFMQ